MKMLKETRITVAVQLAQNVPTTKDFFSNKDLRIRHNRQHGTLGQIMNQVQSTTVINNKKRKKNLFIRPTVCVRSQIGALGAW